MKKRNLASNIILFLFFALVSLAANFSEIFQTPIKTASEMIEQTKLFTAVDLDQIKRISLKNKSGEYVFEKKENAQISLWHMVTPRNIAENSLFIEKLFKALAVIKVKKIFPDEKINNSNFSLDKPTATLGLIDQNGKSINIQVGLMNTIDHSTYLKIAGRNGIFHVEAPTISLENATILDLTESQIFLIDLSKIKSLKISHNKKASLELKKTDGKWSDAENNLLATEKIDDYFQELSAIKSSLILDNQADPQKKQIKSLITNAEYTVSIKDNAANKIDYNISAITKSLSDVDLNEEFFIIATSNSATAYIVKKDFHEIFNRKSDSLKTAVSKN
jgi:hypothetical protein